MKFPKSADNLWLVSNSLRYQVAKQLSTCAADFGILWGFGPRSAPLVLESSKALPYYFKE